MSGLTLIAILGLFVHLAIGTAFSAFVARAAGHKWGIGASLAVAIATWFIGLSGTVLVFFVPPFNRMPGGFMEGGIVTLALAFIVFNFLYFLSLGCFGHFFGRQIARWTKAE